MKTLLDYIKEDIFDVDIHDKKSIFNDLIGRELDGFWVDFHVTIDSIKDDTVIFKGTGNKYSGGVVINKYNQELIHRMLSMGIKEFQFDLQENKRLIFILNDICFPGASFRCPDIVLCPPGARMKEKINISSTKFIANNIFLGINHTLDKSSTSYKNTITLNDVDMFCVYLNIGMMNYNFKINNCDIETTNTYLTFFTNKRNPNNGDVYYNLFKSAYTNAENDIKIDINKLLSCDGLDLNKIKTRNIKTISNLLTDYVVGKDISGPKIGNGWKINSISSGYPWTKIK